MFCEGEMKKEEVRILPNNKAKILAAMKKSKAMNKKVVAKEKEVRSKEKDGLLRADTSCNDIVDISKKEVVVMEDNIEEDFEVIIPKGFEDKYNLGGRPRAFNSPFEMVEKITAYFEECNRRRIEVVTKKGESVSVLDPEPITITGMCAFMGITNQTLNKYQEDKKYQNIILKAKKIVEADHVRRGMQGLAGNFIPFVLKNCFKEEWKDESTTKLEGGFDVKGELPDEVKELLEMMGISGDNEQSGSK